MGAYSSKYYLSFLDNYTDKIEVINVDFDTLNQYLPDKFELIANELAQYLNYLLLKSFDYVLIPNITIHEVLDKYFSSLAINLVHPLKESVNRCKIMKVKCAVLFATKYSMEHNYISDFFRKNGIQIIIPNLDEREVIDQTRRSIFEGDLTKEDINKFKTVLSSYNKDYPVIFGCTELSVLQKTRKYSNIIDMSEFQIEEYMNRN